MARFAVTIVQPPGYPHSAAFREVGESLLYGLRALGHDVVIGADAPKGRRAIVLGSNLLRSKSLGPGLADLPETAILYNLEQMEHGSPWLTPAVLDRFRAHEVWDYSGVNAARYGDLGLPAPRVVPIGYAPELTRIAPAPQEDLDVLFYGSLNDRRQAVLDGLRGAGLRVEDVYGVYGRERDQLIARAKLVLNVHYYEAKVFEVVRVSYLLANRRCVVSEIGADPAEEREFEPSVAFAPYAGLVEACVRLATDPAERARRAEAGFQIISRRDMAAILHPLVGGTLPPWPPKAPQVKPVGTGAALPPPVPPPHTAGSPKMNARATAAVPPPLSLDDVVAMALPAKKRVLILDCGDGEIGAGLLAAGAAEVVGIDPCARGMTRARLTAVYRLDPDGAPELPYPDGYFDLLLVEDLSALVAPGPTLAHFRRWLAGSGALVAVVPNGTHESALVELLSSGRWPAVAGLRPTAFEGALEALDAGGFKPQDDMIAVRTEAGPAADVLRQLAEALGAPPARIGDSLTLVRSIIAGKAAEPGPARAEPLADPWAGSRQVKVLLTPRLDQPGDSWLEAVGGLAAGLSGNKGVTLGIALPLHVLEAPPEALAAAVGEADVDLLLTEAPADQAGWQRLLAGASTWVATSEAPDLRALAALVGVDIQLAG